MGDPRIPIVILAGSDRLPPVMPETARDKHPLAGYKGIEVRIDGRPLIAAVVDRIRASGAFGPIYVIGPAAAYECVRGSATLVESDGTFGQNLQSGIEFCREAHPRTPIGFMTCDVLPDVEALRELMDQYWKQAPCDVWFPLIKAPAETKALGASAWKPAYRIVPEDGQEAIPVLPGHLIVADLDALRLRFVFRLADAIYRTRNRPIHARRWVMVRGTVVALLYQDLLHLLGGRMPSLTWSILSTAISAGRQLRAGTITRARLSETLRKIMVNHRHRKSYPERGVSLPIVNALSLALDIDTEEEARAAGGEVTQPPASSRGG